MTHKLRLQIAGRDGSSREIDARIGASLLAMLRDAGVDEISAMCGGNCSCATCHVYVEAARSVPAPGIAEREMLDTLVHQTPLSRLACQLVVTEDSEFLKVTVAPEE